MNYKNFFMYTVQLILCICTAFAGEEQTQLPEIDECIQKILTEGTQNTLNQDITNKADFILWKEGTQREINAIKSFDETAAHNLQSQFDTKKNSIKFQTLIDGISSYYKKDIEQLVQELEQFKDAYGVDNAAAFDTVITLIQEHTLEAEQSKKVGNTPEQ